MELDLQTYKKPLELLSLIGRSSSALVSGSWGGQGKEDKVAGTLPGIVCAKHLQVFLLLVPTDLAIFWLTTEI